MNEVTDRERREVAERLRGMEFAVWGDPACELAACVGVECVGMGTCHGSGEMPECSKLLANRLADLIEPEPERTCSDKNGRCSECGWPLSLFADYCPDCGAKVVD